MKVCTRIDFRRHGFKARPKWERRDCAVRALASAARIPYPEAHELLSAAGRRNAKGTSVASLWAAAEEHDFKFMEGGGLHRTVEDLLPELARRGGAWILHIDGHYFAMRDGVVYDQDPAFIKPGAKVRTVWHKEQPLKPVLI